jgi:hypothetical protein
MVTTKKTVMALLLCLISFALVSVTHACDPHHDRLQQQKNHHDHKRNRQRRLRKGEVATADKHANHYDHDHDHHHHHDGNGIDCNEDLHADAITNTGTDTQGTEESRELFSVSQETTDFLRVGDFKWATAEAFLEEGGRCHTHDPTPEEVKENDGIVTAFRKRYGSASTGGNRRRLKTIVVPLYFHVLIGNGGEGDLSEKEIEDQIEVLESSFDSFTFELKSITRTENVFWFTASVGSSAEDEFKDALRQGGADALNFYTLKPSDGVLGWATLPNSSSGRNTQDGVCVSYASLPGGSLTRYNLGVLWLCFLFDCVCYVFACISLL